jgi:hypothetical protein
MSGARIKRKPNPGNDKGDGSPLAPLQEVTRYIPDQIQFMLWGKAAGRCEFAGHNAPLWKSSVTQEPLNVAEKAHIYSFSADGPRGNAGIPKEKLNDFGNLMLVCPECHGKMDQFRSGGRYTVELLQAMKAEHERRIELVTAIAPGMTSHVLLYGANIGHHSSPLRFSDAALALFPERYPAEGRAIELGMVDSAVRETSDSFWAVETENLRTKFDERVRERLARGDISHISVFALAPQPLLILFGTMLIDIAGAQVFQRHREPEQSWKWPANAVTPAIEVVEPGADRGGPPALALALSATITSDRITRVLGEDAAIILDPENWAAG